MYAKTGRIEGNYTATVTVSNTSNGISANLLVKFSVSAEPLPSYTVTYNANGALGAAPAAKDETIVKQFEEIATTTTISNTQSITVGPNADEGYYRYAEYANADVYYVISKRKDNSKIHSWETLLAVDTATMQPHRDYSPNGIVEKQEV